MDTSTLKKWFASHREAIFQDYFHFLTFQSIGTDPAFDQQTKACAAWLIDYLSQMGMEVERWDTSGQPVVFAKNCKAGPDRPTLLIYQHYDVQPVDPLELWDTPPFEPTVREGNVYARGAQDNKGQCFYTITAIKALLESAKNFNFNLKLFIDGEEESGSCGTQEVLTEKVDELKSDYLLVVDSSIPGPGIPAITLGTRGILTLEVSCRSADGDMHSGWMGGVAYNPNRALIQMLATLWDENGKIAVPHFYDNVQGLTQEEMAHYHLEIDEKEIKKENGLRALCPEPGYSIGQSSTVRPTLEINGIAGGYAGEGFKTVIPAVAIAKISCRLVPHQDPERVFSHLKAHLLSHTLKGLEMEIKLGEGAPAFRSRHDSLIAKLSSKAYEEVLGKPCQSILIGGSIPIVVDLAKACGGETVLMGFALSSDQIHAPNEHFGLDRFEQGFLTMGNIFNKLNET